MRAVDIIQRKRDGAELSKDEIDFFIRGYAKGDVPDYQAAAFTMAVFFKGMTPAETVALTESMMHTGEVLDLGDLLRTSWLYGVRGQNFLLTMLKLFQERDEVRVVDDQVGAPTWSRMLAEVTAAVLYRMLAPEACGPRPRGLYHVTGAGETSWYGFARRILESSGLSCKLIPITSNEFPAPARRPAYSVLDNTKLRDALGLALPDWQVTLSHCLGDLCWSVRAGSEQRPPRG